MKKLQILWLVVLVMAAGCSKNEMAPQVDTPATDAQALASQVLTADSVSAFTLSDEATIDDGGMRPNEYEGSVLPAGPSPAGLNGALIDTLVPLRWGRHVTGVDRNSQATIVGDSVANILLTKTVTGEFWVGYGTRTSDTTILDTIVKKPFSNVVERKVTFRRIGHHDNPFRNWIPVAVTMVRGASPGGNPFSIVSMEVADRRRARDTTFTDPLNTWFLLGFLRGTVPVVPLDDSITVRVTVTGADTGNEIVHLRQGIGEDHREFRRAPMQRISLTGSAGSYTKVYERTFVTHLPPWDRRPGRFNLVVDVLSRGSVFDPVSPYANEFWGLPYVVIGVP